MLDEPTNHLDLEAINALNIAIQRYEGTVLLVTHDHDLIDEVATRIWHFDQGAHRRLQGTVRGVHDRNCRCAAVGQIATCLLSSMLRESRNRLGPTRFCATLPSRSKNARASG